MSVTDEIKARTDIVQLITKYGVPLKKAGRNYVAPCPFHNERTPSFVVFPDTQGWHCFGACGEGGDIFNFVMKREGLDFVAALRLLAEQAGVALHERSDVQARQDERLDKLRGLLDETAGYFHRLLRESPAAGFARDYVHKRGLNDATLDQFAIGYAPADWQATLDHLERLGYGVEDVIDTGMAIRNETGRVYDRFRNRLMIPIYDERGRAIGFGARALNPDDNPKYLNSPQTPLFDKSGTLFAMHLARRAIRESEVAVIVEGYMDAIQAHQSGFSNVVAQMGTALTKPQLKQLSKYARRLILALDPDAAGAKATMRGLDVVRQASESEQIFFDPTAIMRQASRLDIEIQVVTLPDEKDPDEMIRDDPEGWRTLIAMAQPVADYVIASGTAQLAPHATLAEREQVARDLLPILMATENDLQRHASIQQLAYKLRLGSGRTLVEWAQRLTQSPRVAEEAGSAQQAKPESSKTQALERYCLAAFLRRPDLLSLVNRRLRELAAIAGPGSEALSSLSTEDFTQSDYRAIFDTFSQALAQDDQDIMDYLDQYLPYELRELMEELRVETLVNFEQKLGQPLRAELVGVLRLQHQAASFRAVTEPEIAQQNIIERALKLRERRLIRENEELQLLQHDHDTDPDAQNMYGQRVRVYYSALLHIGNTRISQR